VKNRGIGTTGGDNNLFEKWNVGTRETREKGVYQVKKVTGLLQWAACQEEISQEHVDGI